MDYSKHIKGTANSKPEEVQDLPEWVLIPSMIILIIGAWILLVAF